MTAYIKNFAKSESGAVTVDWVVLTAAIVGLGLAVMAVVSAGVEDLSGDEVDTSNIIEGGRRSRKGRATVFTYTATDLAEDSDED